jgi:hypothetical protein
MLFLKLRICYCSHNDNPSYSRITALRTCPIKCFITQHYGLTNASLHHNNGGKETVYNIL